ncbi:uncharacterized [Tachysurus ichikawai]
MWSSISSFSSVTKHLVPGDSSGNSSRNSSGNSAVASAVRTCVMRSVSDLVMQMDQSDQATQVITKKQEEAGTSTIYKISSFAKPPQSSVWLYEHKIQPIKELISLNPTSEGADLTKPTKLDS